MITYRPAGMQDLHEIWKLNSLYIRPQEPESNLQFVLSKGKAWVAEENGSIIGALVGKTKFEVPYVHSVVTHGLYRDNGIATKLFTDFEDSFKQGNYWLQVHCENPAQKLYFDLGYRVGGFDKDFYGPGEHALCMYKGLTS